MGEDSIIPIAKGQNEHMHKIFSLENRKKYPMRVKMYYEDVLQNTYLQLIEIEYNATGIYLNSTLIGQISYKVNEEILISNPHEVWNTNSKKEIL